MADQTRPFAAESTNRALADWRERTVRAEVGRGSGLPDRFRDALERAYGLDLGAVRLHDDETADRVARSLGTDACTVGADVFVAGRRARPGVGRGGRTRGPRSRPRRPAVPPATGHQPEPQPNTRPRRWPGRSPAGAFPTPPAGAVPGRFRTVTPRCSSATPHGSTACSGTSAHSTST